MTPLIRRYIKMSFVFLVTGLSLGAYIIVVQFVLDDYPPRLLVTAHAHLLLVGFMLMMVMGVATWMFPRPARDDTRYRPELAEAVYWVMTVATALRATAEIGVALAGLLGLRWLVAPGRDRAAGRGRALRAEHVVARAHAARGDAALALTRWPRPPGGELDRPAALA